MLPDNESDRENLIALAELYCESCDIISPQMQIENKEGHFLSKCVARIINNTHRKVEESVDLLKRLRMSPIIDDEKCQELLMQLTAHMNEHSAIEERWGMLQRVFL
jgi:hypothetical protein